MAGSQIDWVATIVFDVINKVISEPGRTATTIHYN
jgi:hypothetical protein